MAKKSAMAQSRARKPRGSVSPELAGYAILRQRIRLLELGINDVIGEVKTFAEYLEHAKEITSKHYLGVPGGHIIFDPSEVNIFRAYTTEILKRLRGALGDGGKVS